MRYGLLLYNDHYWPRFRETLDLIAPGLFRSWVAEHSDLVADTRSEIEYDVQHPDEAKYNGYDAETMLQLATDDAMQHIASMNTFDDIVGEKGRYNNAQRIVIPVTQDL